MKLLVTGADGFTGQHIVPKAKTFGYEVFALQSDLNDSHSINAEIMDIKPDYVVHLAAKSFVGNGDFTAFYLVNVVGTTNLLDALSKLDKAPQRVLLASSANVYGNTKNIPITENETPSPLNHYAMSKIAMEYMARNYLDRLPIFFTRPFNYIGIGQHEMFIIPKLVKHFATKAPFIELGNIDIEREFNDIDLVCDAYIRLLDKALIGEIYNICSGKVYSLHDIIEILSRITHHRLKIHKNPIFLRENEIKTLSGSPKKLFDCVGEIHQMDIDKILSKILNDFIV